MKFRFLYLSALSILLIIFSIGLGLFGVAAGATFGGNYGCIEYSGVSGYEACGLLFGQIGLGIAIIVSVVALIKSYKKIKQYE